MNNPLTHVRRTLHLPPGSTVGPEECVPVLVSCCGSAGQGWIVKRRRITVKTDAALGAAVCEPIPDCCGADPAGGVRENRSLTGRGLSLGAESCPDPSPTCCVPSSPCAVAGRGMPETATLVASGLFHSDPSYPLGWSEPTNQGNGIFNPLLWWEAKATWDGYYWSGVLPFNEKPLRFWVREIPGVIPGTVEGYVYWFSNRCFSAPPPTPPPPLPPDLTFVPEGMTHHFGSSQTCYQGWPVPWGIDLPISSDVGGLWGSCVLSSAGMNLARSFGVGSVRVKLLPNGQPYNAIFPEADLPPLLLNATFVGGWGTKSTVMYCVGGTAGFSLDSHYGAVEIIPGKIIQFFTQSGEVAFNDSGIPYGTIVLSINDLAGSSCMPPPPPGKFWYYEEPAPFPVTFNLADTPCTPGGGTLTIG